MNLADSTTGLTLALRSPGPPRADTRLAIAGRDERDASGLGSTTGLTDGAGTPVKTYAYDVFGAVRSTGIDQADTDFRFTGEREDADVSGLYYLRARYYDPVLGRFWTQDPWGGSTASPQTLNPYPYVGSNPANLVDPAGLCHRGTGHGPTIVDTVKTIFSLGMQQPPKRNCTGDGLAGEPIVAEGEEIADTAEATGDALAPLWPYVSHGIQAGDLLPLGSVPLFGTVPGVILDVAAFIAAEIDIARSSCGGKLGLTATNLVNLGEGLAGNLLPTAPNVVISASEAGLYAGTTGALARCGKE